MTKRSPAPRCRDHAGDAFAVAQQAPGLAVGEQARAGGERLRNERALHRLLLPRRERADAVVAFLAARHLGVLPLQAFDTAPEHCGAARDLGRVQVRHRQLAFELLEVRLQHLRREVGEQRVGAPAVVAIGRQAVPEGAVDLRRAADTAPFDVGDRRLAEDRREAAVAVEAGDRFRRVGGDLAGVEVRTFLEQDDLVAALGERRRGRRAAGARADDQNLGRKRRTAAGGAARITHPRPPGDCRFSPNRGFDGLSPNGTCLVPIRFFPFALSPSKGVLPFSDSLQGGGGAVRLQLRDDGGVVEIDQERRAADQLDEVAHRRHGRVGPQRQKRGPCGRRQRRERAAEAQRRQPGEGEQGEAVGQAQERRHGVDLARDIGGDIARDAAPR